MLIEDLHSGEAQQPCQQVFVAACKPSISSGQRSVVWSGGSEGEGFRIGDVVNDDPLEGYSSGGGYGD